MKIFQVTETLTLGGAETFAVRLANHLAEAHEVYLVVLRPDHIDAALRATLDPRVRLLPLPLRAVRWLERAASAARRLGISYSPLQQATRRACRHLLLEHRPDVVHTHLFKSDLAFAGLQSVHPFRHVATIHGDYSAFFHGDSLPGLAGLKEKMAFALRHLDAIACLCEEHLQFFRDRFGEATRGKLQLVYNGYAQTKNTGAPPALPPGFRFGMVSRGVEKKGWARLIDAFLRLNRPETQLVLVGGGPYLDKLKGEVRHPRIHFTGPSNDPMSYIREFDVCVLPTLFPYESLPTVIIEYLVAGRPIIATDVGEIAGMMRAGAEESGGLLLRFEDGDISVEALRQAMELLLDDADLRKKLEAGSRAAAKKFDMQQCINAYLQLYESR